MAISFVNKTLNNIPKRSEKPITGLNIPNIRTVRLISSFIPMDLSAIPIIGYMNFPGLKVKPAEVRSVNDLMSIGFPPLLVECMAKTLNIENITLMDKKKKPTEIPVLVKHGTFLGAQSSVSLIVNGKLREYDLPKTELSVKKADDEQSIKARRVDKLTGLHVSRGYGEGAAYKIEPWEKGITIKDYTIADDKIDSEVQRYKTAHERAIIKLEDECKSLVDSGLQNSLVDIIDAHLMMMRDNMFSKNIIEKIKNNKKNAERILEATINDEVDKYKKFEADYLREKAADVQDVGRRILEALAGKESDIVDKIKKGQKENIVILAKEITPSQAAALIKVRDQIDGIITELGGDTSHFAIIARSLEIPAVAGVKGAMTEIMDGDKLHVSGGHEGYVLINQGPESRLLNKFKSDKKSYETYLDQIDSVVKDKDSVTKDGKKISLYAAVDSIDYISMIRRRYGSKGIGLFRTEFLFMGKDTPPTVHEHEFAYNRMTKAFSDANPHIILRTFDFGGDKILPHYFGIQDKNSGFMGLRGPRLYFHNDMLNGIFREQVEGILRSSAKNENLSMMFPMITTVDEFGKCYSVVDEIMSSLDKQGIKYNKNIEVGSMIEVPAAVNVADQIAELASFFSVGSNDLIQYMMGAHRGDPDVAYLYDPFNLSIIKSLQRIIEVGNKYKKPVSFCGEMASDPLATLLLMGLGYNHLTIVPGNTNLVKYLIINTEASMCSRFASKVIESQMITGVSNRDWIKNVALSVFPLETIQAMDLVEQQLGIGSKETK